MMDVVVPVVGVLLLLLLFYDVLMTVFHPQGHGGPINRTQNQCVWTLFRAIGQGPNGEPRPKVLAFCGPVLAVLTLSLWVLFLVVGFGLIIYPWISAFPTDPGTVGPAWAKALYYSGFVATTLGIGDVVPPTPGLRLLTVLEATAGFVMFGMGVSYILAVYREIGTASALALDLAGYFARGTGGVLETLRYAGYGPVEHWLDSTTRTLLRITQAHAQYPIIHYFHSPIPEQALEMQVGHLIDLLRDAERSRSMEGITGGERPPSLDALRTALEAHLHEINRYVIPSSFEPLGDDPESMSLRRQHERVLRYLLYAPDASSRD